MNREALLYHSEDNQMIGCDLCSHRCRIAPGKSGLCGVRINIEGKLFSRVYGELIAAHIDPIEKKPLFHYLPGSISFSIATAGCNFRCSFCQNWQISQLSARGYNSSGHPSSPENIVSTALQEGCRSISYTYTEPTIFFELAFDTARLAKEKGLGNVFVTNGFMTAEAIDLIGPYLDACNVDLKSFRDSFYRELCGARLQPVLDRIRHLYSLGIWLEITTLLLPGRNDSDEELMEAAEFISSVNPDIPWHISRFHPDYQYTASGPTPMETLRRAYSIGKKAGLNYIYLGNVWGESEDTLCPHCGEVVISRRGYAVSSMKLKGSACLACRNAIAGIFLNDS